MPNPDKPKDQQDSGHDPLSLALPRVTVEELAARLRLPVQEEVESFLEQTEQTFSPGQNDYYARTALAQALKAFREGNYGIGAVAVVVHERMIYEFPNCNAMVTGIGVHDHAEARAVEDAVAHLQRVLEGREIAEAELARVALLEPERQYRKAMNQWTRALEDGIHVFSSLEPCPMCMCMMINVGTKRAIGNAPDGTLDFSGEIARSDGGANAFGDKLKTVPLVWQMIASKLGLEFRLHQTEHPELKTLSEDIFHANREEIDTYLGERGRNPIEQLRQLEIQPGDSAEEIVRKARDLKLGRPQLQLLINRANEGSGREPTSRN